MYYILIGINTNSSSVAQIAVSSYMIGRIINWDGNWKERLLLVNITIVEMKTIRSTRLTVMRKIYPLNALFVETVSQIRLLPSMIIKAYLIANFFNTNISLITTLLVFFVFFLGASITFVKNVLWNNIGKVHDVIFAMPKLMAPLIQQKNLLHELKWKIRKRLQRARILMKFNKVFLQNYLCFYNFVKSDNII